MSSENLTLYENSFMPDYLNNEDQISYGNLNFDELPIKEEKKAYINSFLPQEIIGVYNNQPTEHEDDLKKAHHLMSEEELDKNDMFSNPPLNFDGEDEQDFLEKNEDFEVFYLLF